ncbi:GNAT family N-acetyltransferase [Aeromicrobium sp. YIM 150415]|uniref:GNAT family N-acetyltransferase n=1 Tax=Aeromicrobium sp. YIM 150415 TaxID=2803912 RepID=UPI001F066491|nr:GNAT family N-acetyltransferase [Aeromicrobium sp. YIM 150415]
MIRAVSGEGAQLCAAGIWARATARRDGVDPQDTASKAEGIRSALSAPGSSLQIADDTDHPVGFSVIVPHEDRLELRYLAVEPAEWGQGIGTALLHHLGEEAARQGFPTLELWVIDTNDRAIALYEATGWQDIGDVAVRHAHGPVERRLIRRLQPEGDRTSWVTLTHDWSRDVDIAHLDEARRSVGDIGVEQVVHMILEVLAYADDEAEAQGRIGSAMVRIHRSGVTVSDDGRGTDTRRDVDGTMIRKPVMATRDVRFYAAATPPTLPDGAPRRGMSTVAAVCEELVHENRRSDGSWYQSYRYGMPVGELEPLPPAREHGTTVHLRGLPPTAVSAIDMGALKDFVGRYCRLAVDVVVD